MTNREKCIRDIEKKLLTVENKTSTFKGVKKCTRVELEMAQMYAKIVGDPSLNLMKPRGNVEQILKVYGII